MRFTGKLYSQIDKINWTKPTTNILLLSALFGWIKHTDFIPYYDLSMNDMIMVRTKRMSVWKFWKESGALATIMKPNNIDLLSENYRKTLNPIASTIVRKPQVIFNDSYGVAKGKWLNKQL